MSLLQRTFGEISNLRNGVNYVVADQGEVVKVVGVGDFQGRTELSTFDSLSEIRLRSHLYPDDELQDGDLLFVRSNGNKSLIGRCMVIRNPPAGVTFSGFTIRARLDKSEALPEYISLVFQGGSLSRQMTLAGGGNGNISNLNQSLLATMPVSLPSLEVQKLLAACASTWDTAIQKIEQLIAAKEQHLAHLRIGLLSKPERAIRVRLGDVTQELSLRNNGSLGREAIMAVTKQFGMRPMREETIAANIARYKLVPPRAFAYNPMRLNIGSIAISPFEHDVLVSPDYVVLACDRSKLLPSYLHHLRHTQKWRRHFDQAGNGSVRVRIYYEDLGRFAFLLPPIDVQARLTRLLDAASQELEFLRQQAGALRTQKRGLMQKLLTGQWRLPTSRNTRR